MPTVTCKCKEVYHASDDHIGKQILCRKCGRKLKIVAERKKRPRKEPRPKPQKAASARPATPPGDRGEPYREEREHLSPVVRKRLMIAGAVVGGMSLLLALQVWRSLHAVPDVKETPPSGDDTGMLRQVQPLPQSVAFAGARIRYVTA